ncbi:hypothetical protein AAVH_27445 [Aphelenchoides avenae]|nr:hypothetical protein AAVH_27445 [Aphelenchus avenae]
MPATIINAVWEHFDVFEDKSFTCKVDNCGQHFNPPLRSTTAMRHLSRKHPDVHIIVFFTEQARKNGVKKEEASDDENNPAAKKSRLAADFDKKAMPTTSHGLKVKKEDSSAEKAMPTDELMPRVLQASSMENVLETLNVSTSEALSGTTTSEQSPVVKKQIEASLQKAVPKQAPTTSKEAKSKSASKALPVTKQADGCAAKTKRKAAVEAEKRIAYINNWLLRVRKEQKVVRAKRSAVHADVEKNQEERISSKRELLLRWSGYDANADSWEPVEHLAGAADLLSAFDAAMDDGFEEETMDDSALHATSDDGFDED